MPSKTVKWGNKVHCLGGANDIMCDFIVFSGKIVPLPKEPISVLVLKQQPN